MDTLNAPPPRLVEDAPALASPNWLPDNSGIGWLDSLGEDHRRLLATREQIARSRHNLALAFEREDAQRQEAMTLAIRTGRRPDLPPITADAQRRARLAAADQQLHAANDALDGFLDDAIAAIREHAVEWLSDLSARRAAAAEKRHAAAQLVIEAEAEETRVYHLEEWVTRNAGIHERPSFRSIPALRFVDWGVTKTLAPPPEPEEDGMGGLRPQLVDNHDPEQFLEDINRGVLPPPFPLTPEQQERVERLRTGGDPGSIPLAPHARPTANQETTP